MASRPMSASTRRLIVTTAGGLLPIARQSSAIRSCREVSDGLALQVVRVEPFSDDALYLGIQHRRTHPTTADPGDHAIDGFMAEVVRHQAPNLPFAYSEFTRFRFDCLCAPNGHLDHLTHRIGTCHGLVPDCILDFVQRSAEHTSELQSLIRISYAVFCLK